MADLGVGGILIMFMGHMGWVFGKTSKRGWEISCPTRFEVGDGSKFGMTCGEGINP
jgi:hypothetical protein